MQERHEQRGLPGVPKQRNDGDEEEVRGLHDAEIAVKRVIAIIHHLLQHNRLVRFALRPKHQLGWILHVVCIVLPAVYTRRR